MARVSSPAPSGITVGELATLRHLRISVVAGEGGLDRAVSWAHVVDHPHPWDWLDPGDLVLTSGWITPRDPAKQVRFVERMAKAGLAGFMMGDDPQCPPLETPALTEDMLAAANAADFPVMLIHRESSFVEISRLVVRANQMREGQALSSIMRIHDVVRNGLVNPRSSAEFLAALSDVVGARLSIVDPRTWEPMLPGTVAPDGVWSEALTRAMSERNGAVPLAVSLEVDSRSAVAVPIPMDRAALLLVETDGGPSPRLALLQHVSAACALEVARVDAMFDQEWKTGWTLLSEALQGRTDPKAFEASLRERGMEPPFVCLAVDAEPPAIDRIDRYWLVRRIPYALTRAGVVTILVHADDARMEEIRALSEDEHFRVGVSEPFGGAAALADAARQARWALETLPPGSEGVATYALDGQSFLPRTVLESQQAVERILGPLIAYDAEHDGELVKTLQTYLACDRSPKRAAEVLFVHNQTVNYRMARIQELTGRSLRNTADISEFWFALRALALTEAGPVPAASVA